MALKLFDGLVYYVIHTTSEDGRFQHKASVYKGCIYFKRGGVYVSKMKNVIGAAIRLRRWVTSVGTHGAVALTVAFLLLLHRALIHAPTH